MSLSATGSYHYCHGHYHFVGCSGVYLQSYPENNIKRRLLSLTDHVRRQTSSDSHS